MSHKKLDDGNRGEEAAVSYLRRLGIQIVERNFRIRGGEIDIIGIEPSTDSGQDTLVFYEVKTRSSNAYGTPFEAISYWKIKALTRAAHVYKMTHPGFPGALRIDAIGVMLDGSGEILTIDLVKNVS